MAREFYMNWKLLKGLKELCKNSMVIRHSIKELLAENNVTRPMNYI